MSANKTRADLLLVQKGLAPSRERARALILGGHVYVGEQRLEKAGDLIRSDSDLKLRGQDHTYVSRGGVKLAGVLDHFNLDPAGLVVADIGASTGGFTDCVLQRDAARVYAIDVGYGQLHERLRNDPRVVVMDRTNARYLTATDLPELVDLVVIDASFIGLEKLLPAAKAIAKPGSIIVAMVKPQFQAGRSAVSKRGVVRDETERLNAIDAVATFAQSIGLTVHGQVDATITGPRGNQEAFLFLKLPKNP